MDHANQSHTRPALSPPLKHPSRADARDAIGAFAEQLVPSRAALHRVKRMPCLFGSHRWLDGLPFDHLAVWEPTGELKVLGDKCHRCGARR